MNTIELFRTYLISGGKTSPVTIKNYLSDVKKFTSWFENKVHREFTPLDLDAENLNLFISENNPLITSQDHQIGLTKQPNYSLRSFERYLSSLRRFAAFLGEANLIHDNPFSNSESKIQDIKPKTDPWNLKPFKDFLYTTGASRITSKNYVVDLNAFTSWLEYKGYHKNNISNYIQVVNPALINEYKDVLARELGLSESTIHRKMSSIRKYLDFGKKAGLITAEFMYTRPIIKPEPEANFNLPLSIREPDFIEKEAELNLESLDSDYEQELNENVTLPNYSSFPPFRLAQKIASPYFIFEEAAAGFLYGVFKGQKLKISKPQVSTPGWYKRYHNLSFVHYLHVSILIIYAGVIGSLIYNNLFVVASQNKTLAANVAPPNVLSFQGRLTDANGKPVTSPQQVRFMIYNNSQATGSAYLLWQELDSIAPNSNGVFSVLLGNTSTVCAGGATQVQSTPCSLPTNIFGSNQNLYIGITVANTPELTPRQQIANVPYASNSQFLQGMLPITASGASSSNVVLALDSSGNLTIGGGATPTFQASGGQFTLSGQTLYLTTATGTGTNVVIAPDTTGLIDLKNAIINSGGNGKIIPGAVEVDDQFAVLATASANAAFIVNNNTSGGDIFAASSSGTTKFRLQNNGDISVQNGASIDTLGTGTIQIGNSNASTVSIGKASSNVLFPGYTGQNGVFYGEYGTGNLKQSTTASTGLCLLSGASNPAWGSCTTGTTSPFQQSLGAIFPNNSTVDFLVGAQSTASATFAVTNINSGTPQASVSGNLIVMPKAQGAAGGNVGIGVSSPTHTLQLWNDDAVKSATTTWTVVSDIRTKTDIGTFSDGLNIINQINPVSFTYNGLGGTATGTQGIGVIAQDVQSVAPYMIGQFDVKLHPNDTNTTKLLDFNPHALFFITVNALKELDGKILAMRESFTTEALNATTITANSISLTSDSMSVAGQSLKDYVANIVEQTIQGQTLVSPLASVEQLHTDIISPLGSDTPIKLNGNVAVSGVATVSGTLTSNSIQTETATISGNLTASSASISGELAANSVNAEQLNARDATVSGTLFANNIKADSIQDLDRRIIEAYHAQVASQSSGLIANLNNQSEIYNNQFLDIGSLQTDFATFRQGLIALGPASFTNMSVSDTFSIGNNLQINSNSINTVGTDLAIQPLRQGAVDFLAGAVRIETDGTLHVNQNAFFAKDIEVGGTIKTDKITTRNGLSIARSSNDEANSNRPSLDVQGAASVSGGLTIDKLNLLNAAAAYAISDTEVMASGSAGTDSIKPNRTELTIFNPNVTDKSLIYVSPVGTNNNNNPALLRQDPGVSFTVGIPQIVPNEVKFNWIIVN